MGCQIQQPQRAGRTGKHMGGIGALPCIGAGPDTRQPTVQVTEETRNRLPNRIRSGIGDLGGQKALIEHGCRIRLIESSGSVSPAE